MAIRFSCKQCDQLLSIAGRKAGAEIECPKCGRIQTVPGEQSAAAAAAPVSSSTGPALQLNDSAVLGDDPAAADSAVPPLPVRQIGDSSGSLPNHNGVLETGGKPVPRGMILLGRRTVYVQGVLFLFVGAFGFSAGYLMGRGDASTDLLADRQAQAKESVLLEGQLVYDPGDGTRVGDDRAVVIVLPQGERPESPLSGQGLRPVDPEMGDTRRNIGRIEALGGAFTRGGSSGAFSVVLSQRGKYYVLLISRHVTRPLDQGFDELDFKEMQRYFPDPDYLVGRSKYRWISKRIDLGAKRVECDFGRSGQE